MALMPGFDTRSAAQVAHQVAGEELEEQRLEQQAEQFEAGMVQRERELAFDAFRANQAFVLQQQQEARIAEAQQREFARRTLEQAVELGVKWDPASRGYRPLAEDDPEYNPWRERQSERKAKLPLSPEKQVELARTKTLAVEQAKLETLPAKIKLEERAAVREAERREKARESEAFTRHRRNLEKLGLEIVAQAERDQRNAEAQKKAAELRQTQAKALVKFKNELEAPARKERAETKAQAEQEKRNRDTYFKAVNANMRAADDLRMAVTKRAEMQEKLWKTFKKQFHDVKQWGWPEPEDIQTGGVLVKEWQAFTDPINQIVQGAQQTLEQTQQDLRRARDAYLAAPTPRLSQPQAQELIDRARAELPAGASNIQIKRRARELAAQQGRSL